MGAIINVAYQIVQKANKYSCLMLESGEHILTETGGSLGFRDRPYQKQDKNQAIFTKIGKNQAIFTKVSKPVRTFTIISKPNNNWTVTEKPNIP